MAIGLIFPVSVPLVPIPAMAVEGGGAGCPWLQDVMVELPGRTLTLGQNAFKNSEEPTTILGHQLYPNLDLLTLRIVSPDGQEWDVALTRLSSGKHCSAFYAGKPVRVIESEHIYGGTIAVR
jgi:hypothetical protein